jgi:hypothetical protein
MDARSFRVALIADDLVNPPSDGWDGLSVLAEEGWGVIQLPPVSYPNRVAVRLLEQIAEQTEEFLRNGYEVVVVGEQPLLGQTLAAVGIHSLPAIAPSSEEDLRLFLASRRARPENVTR